MTNEICTACNTKLQNEEDGYLSDPGIYNLQTVCQYKNCLYRPWLFSDPLSGGYTTALDIPY